MRPLAAKLEIKQNPKQIKEACAWNLKLCAQLNIAAVHCSAPGLISQRWSVKQPATQEFANTSCHLCDSLVDFQRRCCCGKKLSPCHVCLLDGAELLEAGHSSKAGYPGGPPSPFTPPWQEGRTLVWDPHTGPTSSNAI